MKKLFSIILTISTVLCLLSPTFAETTNVDQDLVNQINMVKTIAECNLTGPAENLTVTYGEFTQSADPMEKTPLEWYVLDKTEDKAILLCKKVLLRKLYYKNQDGASFNKSDIKKYMNKDLLEKIFSLPQRNNLLENQLNGANGKLALMTKTDVEKYFISDFTKQLLLSKNARTETPEDYWLMSNEDVRECNYVNAYGSISKAFLGEEMGIRPVISVNIK